VNFTPDQIGLLKWAVRDVLSRRRLDGRSGWATMRALEDLSRHLDATSVGGSESNTPEEELHMKDRIDSKAAAEIIGCTPRWITEIRADLEGRKVGRQWMFPRGVVVEYAELKGAGDDGNRILDVRRGAVPARVA
jgi:hypothetical protein